jgi:hypothetical protein
MADLPQHAAQVAMFLDVINNDIVMQSYEVHWFTPYLVPYLMTAVLSVAFGARRVRIVVAPIELNNERAAMKDFSGSIRTSIQRQSGGQVVAA